MGKLTQYWDVYKKFVSTSVAQQMSFRTSFILLVIMDILFFYSSITSVKFIFGHVENIGPWTEDQLLFFLSFMLMVDNLHMMIFSQSFWEFAEHLKTGSLDYIILRPMNTIFSVFFRHFRASSLVAAPLFIWTLISYGMKVELTTLAWVMLPVLIILSLTLLVILEFILTTAMFWMTDGLGINFLRMQFQQLSRWPDFIYRGLTRKVLLTAIPILLIGRAPVRFLLDQSSMIWPLYLLGAIIVGLFILHNIWKLGLRRYDSASS